MSLFTKKVELTSCCLMVLITTGISYHIYDLEGMCRSGSLDLSLSSTGRNSAGILKATNKISYSLQMDCTVLITAPPRHYVMISVREIEFRVYTLIICKDYLEINGFPICEHIYREDEERHYDSSPRSQMKLFYHTSRDGLNNRTLSGFRGFTLTFTAFTKADEHRGNTTDRFVCDNEYSIWSNLTCDGHNNCGDLSDEDPYGNSQCGRTGRGSTVLIVLGLLILFVLLVMCVATMMCTKNETIRRFSTRLRSRTVSLLTKIS